MPLTNEDRDWIDKRFVQTEERFEKSVAIIHQRIDNHRKDHIEQYHNPVKTWGLWASITSVAIAVGGFGSWLISKLK